MIRPQPRCMCPTSEFPICPSGRPTSSPEMETVQEGKRVARLSMLGVDDWVMAFPSVRGLSPQPSKITRTSGRLSCNRHAPFPSHEASTGLRPWYPSFLRRNPPKHPPTLSALRRVPLAHSSMDLRPWSSAKADKTNSARTQ